MPPVGAIHPVPPGHFGHTERVGALLRVEGVLEDEGPAEGFRLRPVAGGFHELGEAPVGDGEPLDAERAHSCWPALLAISFYDHPGRAAVAAPPFKPDDVFRRGLAFRPARALLLLFRPRLHLGLSRLALTAWGTAAVFHRSAP